jgi:hypothetical protein
MSRSAFTTTFIPPMAKYPERMYYGVDGEDFSFSNIVDATNFDDYLKNYVKPYAQYLAQVDGITNVRLPMVWNVWEKYANETGIAQKYNYRLGKYLETLRDANISVTPVIWSNKTNLSGYYYPLHTIAACAFAGIGPESVVDRGQYEWMNGQYSVVSDYDFTTETLWTGSSVTFATATSTWGATNPSTGKIATIDATGTTPNLSPLFYDKINLPGGVPAQFMVNCKGGSASTAVDFEISTIGTGSNPYYWTGKGWSSSSTKIRLSLTTEDRQFVPIWFETLAESLTENYNLKIYTVGVSSSDTILVNSVELYLVGSEADVRNYFNPRNTSETSFSSATSMLPSETAWRGSLTLNSDIIAPFETNRTPITLPNPGMYRINNYESFFSSSYDSSIPVNNLNVNGAGAYLSDIMATIKGVTGLVIEALDVFEYPFSTARPLFSPRESHCITGFIKKTISTIIADSNYSSELIMVSGTSPEVFGNEEILNKTNGPRIKPFTWIKERVHPDTGNRQYGIDNAFELETNSIFFPEDVEFITLIQIEDYQVIDEYNADNRNTVYNLKLWDELNLDNLTGSSTGFDSENTYHIQDNWISQLTGVSYLGLYCGFSPDLSNEVYPLKNLSNIIENWSSVTVSALDVGCVQKDAYYGKTNWLFSTHWNSYYANDSSDPLAEQGFYITDHDSANTGQSYIPIHLSEPITTGYITYDSLRKNIQHYGTNIEINGVIVDAAKEYLNFANYTLVDGGARVYPAYTTVPLQFETNRSYIYGGTESNDTFFTTVGYNNTETKSLFNNEGYKYDIIWSAEDREVSATIITSDSMNINVFSYEDIEGSLGVVEENTSFTIDVKEGVSRIITAEGFSSLEERTGDQWDHIWAMLPDFWTARFEDTKTMEGMWAGLTDIASNMLSNLYQYDMSKGLATAPFNIVSSNESYPFEESSYFADTDYTFFEGSTVSSSHYMTSDDVNSLPILRKDLGDSKSTEYRENVDYEIKDGNIYFKPGILDTSSTSTLFAPWISYKEEIIYRNFGHFLDFGKKPESVQYKDAVLAGLYGLWNGHTINAFKLICDALSGFPLIPYRGKVKFVHITSTAFSLIVEDQFGNERSIEVPAAFAPSTDRPITVRTGLKTEVEVTNIQDLTGMEVFSLAPATNAFEVFDRVTKPERISILARAIKSSRVGMYNTTVGTVSADNIDKLGDVYEKLGWGSRETMFTDMLKMVEQVRGQYHIFRFLMEKAIEEELLIKEPKPYVTLALDVAPSFDHNLYNYMHDGDEFSVEGKEVSIALGITKEGAERNRFNPNEKRVAGQKYQDIAVGETIKPKTVFASLGDKGLEDGSKSGWTVGFDRIKKAASSVFKFIPSFFSTDQTKHSTANSSYVFSVENFRDTHKDSLVTWESNTNDLSLFSHYGSGGSGEWYATIDSEHPTLPLNQYFEYPQSQMNSIGDVMDMQIRTVIGSKLTRSKGLTALTRVRPRSKGIIFELSGLLTEDGTPPPPVVGACCVPSNTVCGPCTPPTPVQTSYNPGTGVCAQNYTCQDGFTEGACASAGGWWKGPGIACSSTVHCDIPVAKCCGSSDDHSGKHCPSAVDHCSQYNHDCEDQWYDEYCVCEGGSFHVGEDCTPTYDCIGNRVSGPCCSENNPPGEIEGEGEPPGGPSPPPPAPTGLTDRITVSAGGYICHPALESECYASETGVSFENCGLAPCGDAYINYTVSNNNSSGVISGTISIPNASGWHFDTTEMNSNGDIDIYLESGNSATFKVYYPLIHSALTYTKTLRFTDSEGSVSSSFPGDTIDIDYSTNDQTLSVSDTISLGSIVVSSLPYTKTFTVSNTGLVNTLLGHMGSESKNAFSLAAGKSMDFTLTYTSADIGSINESITVTTNDITKVITVYGEIIEDSITGTINSGNPIVFGNVDENNNKKVNFTVQNTSAIPVDISPEIDAFTITETDDSSLSSPYTLAAGASHSFTIVYSPGELTENQVMSEYLSVEVAEFSPILVTAVGIDTSPYITITEKTVDFGSVTIGNSRDIGEVITVENSGLSDLTVSLSSAGDFTTQFAGGSNYLVIEKGDTQTVEGTFTPTDTGNRLSSIIIEHDGASLDTQSVTIYGTGATASSGKFIATPGTVDNSLFTGFLLEDGGPYTSGDITFRNGSTPGTVDIQGTISVIDSLSEFTLVGSSSLNLANSSSTAVNQVLFSPTTSFDTDASIDITGEVSAGSGATVEQFTPINLTVGPVWGPVLSMYSSDFTIYTVSETTPPGGEDDSKTFRILTDNIDFGNSVYGVANPTSTITIVNTGGGTLSGAISDSLATNYSIVETTKTFSLTNMQTAVFNIKYTITETNGVHNNEQIEITTTTGESGYSTGGILCSGQSTAQVTNLTIDPLILNFGDSVGNGSIINKTFTVTSLASSNTNAELAVSSNLPNFTVSGNTTQSLAPGASETFTVTYHPSGKQSSDVTHTGVISVYGDLTVSVEGTTLASTLYSLTEGVDFGDVYLSEIETSDLTLTNLDDNAISVVYSSDNAAVTLNTASQDILLDGVNTTTLTLNPTVVGPFGSTITAVISDNLGVTIGTEHINVSAVILEDLITGTISENTVFSIDEGSANQIVTITISNDSTSTAAMEGTLSLSAVDGGSISEFTLNDTAYSVSPGNSSNVTVTFTTPANVATDTLYQVNVLSSHFNPVNIQSTVFDTDPYILITNNNTDFGTIISTDTKTITPVVTIKNTGRTDLGITLTEGTVFNWSFSSTELTSHTITLSENAFVEVTGLLTPVSVGAVTENLIFTSNDSGVAGSTDTIAITANVVSAPEVHIEASPTSLESDDFSPYIYSDSGSTTTSVILSNGSTDNLDVSGDISISGTMFSLTGEDGSGNLAVSLANSSSTQSVIVDLSTTGLTTTVTGDPAISESITMGTLTSVTSSSYTVNAFNAMSVSDITVWGPVLSIDNAETSPPLASRALQADLDFGSTTYGYHTDPTDTFIIKNIGGGTLAGTIAYTGDLSGATSFSLTRGQSSTITVTAAIVNATRDIVGGVTVTCTGCSTGYETLSVNYIGDMSSSVSNVSVAPSSLVYDNVQSGEVPTKIITITNEASSTVDVTLDASIDNTDFSLTGGLTNTITPSNSELISVIYTAPDYIDFDSIVTANFIDGIGDTVPVTVNLIKDPINIVVSENSLLDFGMVNITASKTIPGAFIISNNGGSGTVTLPSNDIVSFTNNGGEASFTMERWEYVSVTAVFTALTETLHNSSIDVYGTDISYKAQGISRQGDIGIENKGTKYNSTILTPTTSIVSSAVNLGNRSTHSVYGELEIVSCALGTGNVIANWDIKNSGVSDRHYSLDKTSTEELTVELAANATAGQWVYVVDKNINPYISFFRPHVLRSQATNNYILPVHAAQSPYTGVLPYDKGYTFSGQNQIIRANRGDYYIQFSLNNDTGGPVTIASVNGFDYNTSIFTGLYPGASGNPPIDFNTDLLIATNYVLPAENNTFWIKLTAPDTAGVYYSILLFDNQVEPIAFKITVAPGTSAPQGPSYCNCCIGINTPNVYCDDSLTESQCYAAGGIPNKANCEDYGSMGSMPQ